VAAAAPRDVAVRVEESIRVVRDGYGETFDIVMDQVETIQAHTKLIADALQGVVSTPRLDPNDLAEVVEEQLAELDPVARHRGVEVRRRFEPGARCRFDRFHVERAVFNLVDNAIAATAPGGSVTITITDGVEARFGGGPCVEIAVTDTGCGMAPAVLDGILRGEPKSTKAGGTGLGTRIVFNAAAAHGGFLDGETREGAGTTFRLRLPLLE
jgi:signal transduction histidine kinase